MAAAAAMTTTFKKGAIGHRTNDRPKAEGGGWLCSLAHTLENGFGRREGILAQATRNGHYLHNK